MRSLSWCLFASLACVSLVVALGSNVMGQSSYVVTVTVQGLPANASTIVYVDGSPNGTMSGGQSRSFNFSGSATHYIVVQSYVPDFNGQGGTRYYEKDTSWAFSAGGSHVFTYTAQYYLTLQTSYSSARGDGWYDSGSVAQATLEDGEVDESQGTRQVFTGWTGDASGTGLVSDSILMNGPKTATANWKTQFYLAIESDPLGVSNLSGSGWYDAGTQASISAAATIPATEDTRLKFSHWSGAFDGQSPSGSVLMERPKTVKAHYLAQYLLAVQYDPASIQLSFNETHVGWYDANANVQLGPVPTIISLSSVERLVFSGWAENGSSLRDLSMTVLMNHPHKVILSYRTQYYVDVRSSYGSVTGSDWYDRGSTARLSASGTAGTWPVSYALSGWTVDPSTGRLNKVDGAWTILVDRPYIIQANWSVDYLPIVGLAGGLALLVVALAATFVVARKRGLLTRGRSVGLFRSGGIRSRSTRMRVCTSCGNRIPEGAAFCQRCGAAAVEAVAQSPLEEKVYHYIVKHEGVISLSKASTDLGISVEQLETITARLKKEGRLA